MERTIMLMLLNGRIARINDLFQNNPLIEKTPFMIANIA